MIIPDGLQALRRANPRSQPDFGAAVEGCAEAVRSRMGVVDVGCEAPPSRARRGVRLSLLGAPLVAVAAAVALVFGPPGTGRGFESAAAAVHRAASQTAASAQLSGTAVVRVTRAGELWAGVTIRWHGDDLSLSRGTPQRSGRAGTQFLLVGGTMYGVEDGVWVELGSPDSIDPDSGTTPAEYLAAVREDVGGATLRRITTGMTALTLRQLDDGSTIYGGNVLAGLIARETGVKEGEAIRVLPFGYVAHDEAADPSARLRAEVTTGPDDVVRGIRVSWGEPSSQWSFSVDYSDLGATPALVAPSKARPLREILRRAPAGG